MIAVDLANGLVFAWDNRTRRAGERRALSSSAAGSPRHAGLH